MFCTPVHPAGFGSNSYYYPTPQFNQPRSHRNHGHGYSYDNDDDEDYLSSYARPSFSPYYNTSAYAKALERERAAQAKQEAFRRAAYEAQLKREYAARERQRQRAAEERAAAEEYKRHLLSQLFGQPTTHNPVQVQYPVASTSSDLAHNDSESEEDEVDDQEDDDTDADEDVQDHETVSGNKRSEPDAPVSSDKANGTEVTGLSYNDAVEIIRRRGAEAVLLRQRLRALNTIWDTFEQRRRGFSLPDTLDFDTTKSEASGSPILTYTPTNRPLQAYEEDLLRLLTDLDDVPSSGLETVKKTRKALAKDIQSELSRIDEYKTTLLHDARSSR